MLLFNLSPKSVRIIIIFSGFLLSSAKLEARSSESSKKSSPTSFRIMTYNVENLFDTDHDEGKEDWTYLPLAKKDGKVRAECAAKAKEGARRRECEQLDWSPEVLQEKLKRLAQVILKSHEGRGPDLLILAEVENLKVLQQLRDHHLKEAGYTSLVLLEGPDERGIDTAILSRWPQRAQATLHPIPFSEAVSKNKKGEIKTRGILEVSFDLPNGQRATTFAVHFPAPYHPTQQRREALETLNTLAEKASKTSDLVLAGGDFNINHKEDSTLYRGLASPLWEVSHLVGCHSCLGSHYFDKEESWSFLDAILLYRKANAEKSAYRIVADSVRVIREPEIQLSPEGYPLGFEPRSTKGVSDHLPLALEVRKEN